ncbi:MAG: hypothetical protein Salg2KO_12320 [Salibacteraceae bacterium]
MLRLTYTCVLVIFVSLSHAQYMQAPLNPEQTVLVQAHYAKSDELKPMGFAPYLIPLYELDSIYDADTKKWDRKEYKSWVMRKLKNEHLFEVHTADFHLLGDAAFNLEGSPSTDDQGRRLYTNTRGYNFNGYIGKRIFFQTSFYETQSIFPNYLDSVVSTRGDFNKPTDPERGAVPGFGRWKDNNTSKSYDYDYTLATGTFGVVINENSFVQFGHDKQFVGYGFRSMLLSDASSPYPFLRGQFSFWNNRITYTTTYAVLQSLDRNGVAPGAAKESPFRRLGARFSYLSFQPANWFSLGFFDGTTWTWGSNSSPRSVEYYSPHAFLYTGAGIRNQIVGLNGQVTLFKRLQGYGQYAMNTKGRGQAAQVGLKLFGPIPNMILQAEINRVGQSFYFHSSDSSGTTIIEEPFQTGTSVLDYYQNNDLILGHPLGVAMQEIILKGNYRLRDFFANGALHVMSFNSVSNPQTAYFIKGEGGYIINPKSNAQIVGGIIYRTASSDVGIGATTTETYPYVAFRTNLFNRYMAF